MLKKGFKQLLAEANAVIETVSVSGALALVDDPNAVFIDLRDASEQKQGVIKGAAHAPRGVLEFQADPESPLYNPAFQVNKKMVLYCASGGRSALAAKTLLDMGYDDVCHVAGGFAAWSASGGPTDDE